MAACQVGRLVSISLLYTVNALLDVLRAPAKIKVLEWILMKDYAAQIQLPLHDTLISSARERVQSGRDHYQD